MIRVFYDGCCEPRNPGGYAGFGAVIFKDGEEINSISQFHPARPTNSNNVAEYLGLTSALEWLLDHGFKDEEIHFFGDNKMTVMQMMERWRAKQGNYIPYYQRALAIRKKFSRLDFSWIPREENGIADELSKGQLIKNNVQFKIQPR